MDPKLPDILEIDSASFEKLVSTYIKKMGFDIESSEELSDGSARYLVKSANPMGGKILSLIRAGPYERMVGVKAIEELCGDMASKGAVRAAFITTSDFTPDAVDYARDKPVSLINKFELFESIRATGVEVDESFMKLLEEHGLAEERYKGEKHAFELGLTEDAAAEYFAGRVAKKMFGVFGVEEELSSMSKRYAPVEVFKVTYSQKVSSGGGAYSKVETEDYVFVNLHNLEWYYIMRKRSMASTSYSIESSGILSEIESLPEGAKTHLLDLLKHGDLPFEHLDDKDFAILKAKGIATTYRADAKYPASEGLQDLARMLVYVSQELLDLVIILIHDVLGEFSGTISRELSSAEPPEEGEKRVTASVNVPEVSGGVYNLRRFLSVERGVVSSGEEDAVIHPSKRVGEVLSSVLKAKVEPLGLIFMPYYVAVFARKDETGMARREVLFAPLFVTEDKPKKAVKQKVPEDKMDSRVMKGIPYRIVK